MVAICSTWLSGLSDRALLLGLPAMASLAAFALPTLRRSMGAFIDWFTLIFFSAGALIIWVVWLSLQTGVPAQPAINVSRLAPGFEPYFSSAAFTFALLASLVWASLVKWRAGRHRSAIWKSMALPAGGATLCWLLVMTLWLPVLNFARSYEPLVVKVRSMMGDVQCVHYYGLTRAQGAAFEYHGKLKLLPAPTIASGGTANNPECDWLIVDTQAINTLGKDLPTSVWQYQATVRRPTDNNEDIVLYKKQITSLVTKP
jgi:4-amino-4-deoxy-L-arabinose transferase-like glycosyltransferase